MTEPRALVSDEGTSDSDMPAEVRRVREIEERHDPFSVRFDGWCAWAVLRPHAIGRLAQLPTVAAARMSSRSRVRLAAGDAARLALSGRRRFVFKTYASGLAEVAGDRFRDVWFDDLVDELDGAFKVEQINNPRFLERSARARRPRDTTNELLDGFAAGALARAAGAPGASAAATAMRARLADVPELASLDEATMTRVLATFYWGVRLWERLLRRVRPTAVLVADPSEVPLVAAARRRRIPVVELQHGLNDPAHHAAYAWSPAARAWKHLLPLPDRLFLYGEHWRQRLAAGGFWDDELTTVGSPRMDRHRRAVASRSTERGLVAVTTQGIDVPATVDFLASTLDRLGTSADLTFALKLHPAFETDRGPYLERFGGDARVRVLLGSDEPSTLTLLSQAHLHVSISSTCHYEALALGTPTAVLPLSTHRIALPLCRAGHATLLQTPADLARLSSGWRDLRVPPAVGDHYFSPGATARMRRELAALVRAAGPLTHPGGA